MKRDEPRNLRRPRKYAPDYRKYESEKQAWMAKHPKATSDQYTAAMRAIATKCGI